MRLQLHALAYNLATFLRCIELPDRREILRVSEAQCFYLALAKPPVSSVEL